MPKSNYPKVVRAGGFIEVAKLNPRLWSAIVYFDHYPTDEEIVKLDRAAKIAFDRGDEE